VHSGCRITRQRRDKGARTSTRRSPTRRAPISPRQRLGGCFPAVAELIQVSAEAGWKARQEDKAHRVPIDVRAGRVEHRVEMASTARP
jgi:hypothetical protein